MDQNKEKILYISQYHFNKGGNASCEKNFGVDGEGAISKSAARKWFACFCSRNFDVKDEPPSGRPITEKNYEILEKIERDRHMSSHDIVYELNIHHQTVLSHLQKAALASCVTDVQPKITDINRDFNLGLD